MKKPTGYLVLAWEDGGEVCWVSQGEDFDGQVDSFNDYKERVEQGESDDDYVVLVPTLAFHVSSKI